MTAPRPKEPETAGGLSTAARTTAEVGTAGLPTLVLGAAGLKTAVPGTPRQGTARPGAVAADGRGTRSSTASAPADAPTSATRRALVSAAVAGAALGVLAERTRTVRSLGDAPESMEVARARALLRSLSLHEMEAAALGRRVIAGAVVTGAGTTTIPAGTLRAPQDVRAALGKLATDIAAAAGLSAEDLDANDRLRLARRLRRAVRADFRRGDTVRVDGWLLAATESRLFAMAALLSRYP